jgi:regulator of protease activity HflC (stomatin/prohibitin superfamily)
METQIDFSNKARGYLPFPYVVGLLALALLLAIGAAVLITSFPGTGVIGPIALFAIVGLIVLWVVTKGYIKRPNEAVVFTRLGTYIGTDTTGSGIRLAFPLQASTTVNMQTRIVSSAKAKVLDNSGTPIETSANFQVAVREPAKALFVADDYEANVQQLCNTGLREIVQTLPYADINAMTYERSAYASADGSVGTGRLVFSTPQSDTHTRANTKLSTLLDKFSEIGVSLNGFGIENLSYSPEIASAMLQKQQAQALVEAKETLASGVVGIARDISSKVSSDMSKESRETLTRNLIVTLMGNEAPQTVVPV